MLLYTPIGLHPQDTDAVLKAKIAKVRQQIAPKSHYGDAR